MTILPFAFSLVILAASPEIVIKRDAHGKIARSRATVQQFMRSYPPPPWCQTAGKYDGKKCEVDHAIPLCAGGPDETWNLQYQRRSDADKKDKLEARLCRQLKACGVVK